MKVKAKKPPSIKKLALGEIDDFRCLVDQHKAERDQPVDAAERDSAHQLLNEIQHPSAFPHSGRRAIFMIVSSRPEKAFPAGHKGMFGEFQQADFVGLRTLPRDRTPEVR